MALIATPLHRGQSYERNNASQAQSVVSFSVNGPYSAVENAIANNVFIEGLPEPFDEHPTDQLSLVRSRRVRENGVESIVDVVYSTSNTGQLLYAAPDVTEGQWIWSATFENFVKVNIPFAFRNTISVSNGNQVVTKQVWDSGVLDYEEKRTIVRVEWEIYNPDLNAIMEFERQVGFIHEIGGYRYLFKPASITPKDNLTYRVVASWAYDDGTRTRPSRDPSKLLMPGDGNFTISPPPNAGYMRDPYNRLEVVKSDDPENDPASIIQVLDHYDGAPLSWRSLPGVPNL